MWAVSPCLVSKISQSSARIPWREAELQKMLSWSREQEREGRQYRPLQKSRRRDASLRRRSALASGSLIFCFQRILTNLP
jgi:hypothetical protein